MESQSLPLKPERLAALERYAHSHGQTPADALDELLAVQLGRDDKPVLSPEERMRELKAWSDRNASRNLPVLSNEDLRRENLYDDRGL